MMSRYIYICSTIFVGIEKMNETAFTWNLHIENSTYKTDAFSFE